MPTRRMIDPAFWRSESMAKLTEAQRLLFIGIVSNADDQGRMKAHPSLIRADVYPYDDKSLDDIKIDLEAITEVGSIYLYKIDGIEYLQIPKWWNYQAPQWAYPSKIPAPPGWRDRLRYRKGNKVFSENWGNDALPNALGKALPKGDTQSDTQSDRWAYSISISNSISNSNNNDEPPSADAGASLPGSNSDNLPRNLDGWLAFVRAGQGQKGGMTARLHRMITTLYPDSPSPDYGRVGTGAKRVGGASRLAHLVWMSQGHRVTGDVISYCEKMHSGGDDGQKGRSTPAGTKTAESIQAKEVKRVLGPNA